MLIVNLVPIFVLISDVFRCIFKHSCQESTPNIFLFLDKPLD